jgi:hypothetical protein
VRAAAVAAIVACSTVAAAQTARETQAKGYFQSGKAAFEKGQYLVAISAFEEAYQLDARASVVYALALAYKEQWRRDGDVGKLRRAATLFREYLGLPKNDKKAKAQAALDEIAPAIEQADADAAAAAAAATPPDESAAKTLLILLARVDGGRVVFDGAAPVDLPAVVETTPGKHRILAFAAGRATDEREVFAVEGQTVSVEVALDDLPTNVTVHSVRDADVAVDGRIVGTAGETLSIEPGLHSLDVLARGHRRWHDDIDVQAGIDLSVTAPLGRSLRRTASFLTFGAAGALALTAGGFGLWAFSAQDTVVGYDRRIHDGETLTPAERDAHNAAIDDRDARRLASEWLFAGAGIAAAVAAYLYWFDLPSPGGLTVAPAHGGGELTLTRSF